MPEEGSRRTVVIRGQVVDRYSPRETYEQRARGANRARRGSYGRSPAKPDRIALWAVLLGLVLVLVAATSSHAAVTHFAHLALSAH